jgi:dipeptidyl aminopeptidase/acylaminoacyl peptidase
MTGRYDLDRELSAYLGARATSQAPDGLLEGALAQIGVTRQRPGWLVVDRWFSAQATVRLAWVMRGSARVALVALLIAIAVAAVVLVGSQRRLPPPYGLARPGLIVYNWTDHLFVKNADGSGRRQLTFGPNSDYRPTWSPDGTLIAYLSYDRHRSQALMVVSADGQRQVTIADRLAPLDSDQITWAPDSRHLAFAAAAADQPLSLSHIYVADADQSGATEIGGPGLAGFDPAWSPDGKQIAFKNVNPIDALWLMNADGSNAHPLTMTPGSGYAFWNAQWSPDGTHVAFLAGDDGAHEVWTIKVDGTDERNISNSQEDEWWPSWSPDGAKIAFVRISYPNRGGFVVVNADGSEPEALSGPAVDGNMPIWSPDATKLYGFELVSGSINHHVVKVPPIGWHDAIIVYDLVDNTPPTTIHDADDGTWQRLAE